MAIKRLIKTAKSNHNYCFICNKSRKIIKLHEVNEKIIIEAYKQHKIYIKHHARCCKSHLNEIGLIKSEVFKLIPLKLTKQKPKDLMIIELFTKQQKGVFDFFEDIENLTNEHCIKITGWSKAEFLQFSKYITSLNDNSNRSKFQLIALYRYWLRKGIDQTSLAFLFNFKYTQNQISHFLRQIRIAIYKDFVPYFLGTRHGKEFFLKHNNIMASILHDLTNEELAIFVDGTYCKCEKSKNNQFQYDSYSEQKKTSLIKPFLMCCADGYIIDCYGPFKANKNDSTIFNYVLEEDNELLKILENGKTAVFLDRGFRDIYKRLIDNYNFKAKIPTCQQLENDELREQKKQLTIKQTTESRFVTKCRFIIEKVFSSLKNLKSLDNIRNTQIGHIQIDYRIACAMINFLHKPCCPDGKNALVIANRMKEKSKESVNHLEIFFEKKKQLNTSKIYQINLSEINDFPRLTLEDIKEKIFFGTFQYNQSKSYMADIIDNGKAFLVSNDLLISLSNTFNDFSNSKIIAFEVASRHRRSEMKKISKKKENSNKKTHFKLNYKVFIQYIPNVNDAKSVKGRLIN